MAGLRLPDSRLPFHPSETLALCVCTVGKKARGFQKFVQASRTRIGFAAQVHRKSPKLLAERIQKEGPQNLPTGICPAERRFKDRDGAETEGADSRWLAQLEN